MTHQLKSGVNSSSSSRGMSNNNYYGFASSHNRNDNDASDRTRAETELAGGGLSFVIHSPNSNTTNQQQHNNNQQLGSISSVASSTSSGISSGSSTITKSSTFNGNTFTRSKPKERKPLPNGWQHQQQEAEKEHHHPQQPQSPSATNTSSAGPLNLKVKGIPSPSGTGIPTVTLSEPTPPPRKEKINLSSSSSSSSPGNFFSKDTSNSSTGSVVQPSGSVNSSKQRSSNSNSSSSNSSFIHFTPKSSSTFIHLDQSVEGDDDSCENLIDESATTVEGPSHKSKSSKNLVGASSNFVSKSLFSNSHNNHDTSNSSSDKSGSKSGRSSEFPGINKMRDLHSSSELRTISSGEVDTNGNGSGGDSPGSPNGSSSGNPSNLSGEEENFECYGEGSESLTFLDSTSGSGDTSLQYSRDGTDLDLNGSGLLGSGNNSSLSRNSWIRTSLRKSPQNSSATDAMGYRRWGSFRNPSGTKRTPPVVTSSNALANQLYRSSSFHSSGRSSAGDAEEMYSDGSLEDEVIDLTHKVHHLEEKMNVLTENQTDADDRYVREKEKNAELSTKVFMLEEQLRETELRADEKLREEQRRFKEFQSRWDREKQLQSENHEIKQQSMEKDLATVKTESQRLRYQLERERSEKENVSDKLMDMERELGLLREQNRELTDQNRKDREQLAAESAGAQQALLELKKEVEGMRQFQMQNSPSSLRSLRHEDCNIEEELLEGQELKSRVKEFEDEIKRLKRINQDLQDSNDELNAQLLNRGLEEGRTLLTTINSVPAGDSLAAEFEAMSQDQSALGLIVDSETDLAKVKKALKEQIEVNEQLRSYIDGILLIIVENNPQLLEVKNNNTTQHCTKTSISNGNATTAPAAAAVKEQKQASPVTQQPHSNNRISFTNGLAKIAFKK